MFEEQKKRRGVENIAVYQTPKFRRLSAPEMAGGEIDRHVWKTGSRFYKLAAEYYGDPNLWWVIAYYNKKPTDSHVTIGDVVYIPFSPDVIATLV